MILQHKNEIELPINSHRNPACRYAGDEVSYCRCLVGNSNCLRVNAAYIIPLIGLEDFLTENRAIIQYVYHTPERYSNEWLSRDPGRPRIVYKLGGEAKLGLPTMLLILTGYDPERVDQLIRFFDPYYTLLGVQSGEQFNNQSMNVANYEHYKREPGVTLFSFDAYEDDHGFSSIETQLKIYLDNYNIVMSSLGPKLSAIALYKLHEKYPQTALAYAPSNEFNLEYSFGIGKTFTNQLATKQEGKADHSEESNSD